MNSKWHVTGGAPLRGSLRVQGSKNAVLPVIAASLLCANETELLNCPRLSDVEAAAEILGHLGCPARRQEDALLIDTRSPDRFDIPVDLMNKMRSSVIFLGPLLARFGQAEISVPGGCELGERPIDLHLYAMRMLGAEIREEGETVLARTDGLKGAEISFRLPSVGATENAMIAACAAEGPTVIYNAAREPEIETLQEYLRALGAEVSGAGSPVIRITGFAPRSHAGLRVPPDRIAAATYLCCCACAGGEIHLTDVCPDCLRPVLEALEKMGCAVSAGQREIHMASRRRLRSPGAVVTRPYPGFPTDAAPLLMAACLRADGSTAFIENIFQSRFRHGEEMRHMGADITIRGPLAIVTGVERLRGARVQSTDLRGGAALIAAALGAEGESVILDPGHITRGYDALESRLRQLGAEIWQEQY